MTQFNTNSGYSQWSGSNPLFEASPQFAQNSLFESSHSSVLEPDIEMINLDHDKSVTQTADPQAVERRETQNNTIKKSSVSTFSMLGQSLSQLGQTLHRKARRLTNSEAMHHHAKTQTEEFYINTISVDHTNTYATAKLNHKEIVQNATSANNLKTHLYKHLNFEEALFVERLLKMGESGALSALSDYKNGIMEARMVDPALIDQAKSKVEHLEHQARLNNSDAKKLIPTLELLFEARAELQTLLKIVKGPDAQAQHSYETTTKNYASEIRELKNLSHVVSMGNINKTLTTTIQAHKVLGHEDARVLSNLIQLREYSFKINQRESFRESKAKLENVIHKLQSGDPLSGGEKLTHADLKILYSFTNFADTLSHFTEVRSGNTKLLGEIAGTVKMMEKLESQLRSESKAKSGNLVFFDLETSVEILKGKKNMRDWLESTFVTDLSHAGVINSNPDGLQISHIWKEYESKPLNMADFAMGTVYQLNVSHLISSDGLDWMKENYGAENVQDVLQQKFEAISNHFHTDSEDQLKGIMNSKSRQEGAASLQHTRRNLLGCAVEKDLSTIPFAGKKEMICSEFAAKATLHCLNLLNSELRSEYKQYLIEKRNISSDIAELAVKKRTFLKHPIPNTEKLKKLPPERLYQFLEPHLSPVAPPPSLDKVLNSR